MSAKTLTPLLAIAALFGAIGLSACNTVRGAGQDVQRAGEAIEETAQDLNDGNPGTP